MLVSGKKILKHAYENGYAIPAFGFVNLEGAKAIIKAAEEMNSPVILQTTEGGIKYGGLEQLLAIAKSYAKESFVPVAIHLDHGKDIELIKKAIDLGYTSVMYDGSHLDINENISNSKEVNQYIGDKDISLEVEVGTIGGKEDDVQAESSIYASLDDVININDLANPSSIAVAVGTSHGLYKGKININYELIKTSREATGKSIVVHGASGLSEEHIKNCVKYGANKINFDTELKQALIKGIMEHMNKNKDDYDIRKIMQLGIQYQVDIAKKRIEECGSNEKMFLEDNC